MTKNYEEEMKFCQIDIPKAIAWYISLLKKEHKMKYSQKEIAREINMSDTGLSRKLIMPKDAPEIIDFESFKKKEKRRLTISEAKGICKKIDVTLPDVLYFYEHRKFFEENPSMIDKIKLLTNKLTNTNELMAGLSNIKNHDEDICMRSNLVNNINHEEFKPWFGRYYCYFSSTSSDEAGMIRKVNFDKESDNKEIDELLKLSQDDYIFCGILEIFEKNIFDDELCHVQFKFLANPDKKVVKKYKGFLTISKTRDAVFCELISNEEGEIVYFIVEKKEMSSSRPQVECCMAMVLTFSSKEGKRRPCCEKMIISKNTVEKGTEAYQALKANLLMNDNKIRITRWGYEQLIGNIKESQDKYLQEIIEKYPNLDSLRGKTVPIEECAFIPESVVKNLNNISKEARKRFEILLRIHSIAPWYCKTKSSKANELFEFISDSSD